MSLPPFCVDRDAVLKDPSPDIKWRNGIPNYSKANTLFDKHKTTDHQPGSLQFIVQNIVKNWEKEVSHKTDPRQWLTVNLDNYRFSCNGQKKYSGWEMLKQGTYNALIGQTNYYDSNAISFEESHVVFKRSLGEGFAWEVLEVFSGPPTVTFSWRHFGRMTDYFSCPGLSGLVYKADPTNRMVKVFGMCKATVTEQFQIEDLQVFYDPSQLFTQLTEICPFAPFVKLPNSFDPSKGTTTKGQTPQNGGTLPFISKKDVEENELMNSKKVENYILNPRSKMCIIS